MNELPHRKPAWAGKQLGIGKQTNDRPDRRIKSSPASGGIQIIFRHKLTSNFLRQNHQDTMKFPPFLQSQDPRKHVSYAGLGIGLFLTILVLLCAPTLREWGYAFVPQSHYESTTDQSKKKLERDIQRLKGKIRRLRQSLQYRIPREPYLIIDTSDNMFILMTRGKTLYKSVCSTGSYILLKTKNKKEKWVFKTPRGLFRVQNIIEDPIWRMPDWAFIEEGLPIPPEDSPKRFERGVLGDYGFDLGHGYLIHGTLYQRFLGMPVTHGCVRLGDKELQIVYKNMRLGSKVFIY